MKGWQKIARLARQLVLGGLVLLLCCGCVQYRMELAFNWLSGGTIVQNLKWDSEVGTFIGSFSEIAADELLEEIERRAKAAGGTADFLSDSEMRVEIPFDNYRQLETKFNTFFDRPLQLLSNGTVPKDRQHVSESKGRRRGPLPQQLARATSPQNFELSKHGFFVIDRYDLSYSIDLTDLKLPISGGFFSISADRLLDLRVALKTPLVASSSNAAVREGNRLEWHLNTGTLNQLTASFWTPSPLGIVLLVAGALSAFALAWRLLDRANSRG